MHIELRKIISQEAQKPKAGNTIQIMFGKVTHSTSSLNVHFLYLWEWIAARMSMATVLRTVSTSAGMSYRPIFMKLYA